MPDASTLLVFALAAGVLVVIPGPNHLYIVARSVSQGRRAGIASALGVEVGTLVHVAAAAVGLSAVIASSALAFAVVKYAGAAYLLYLGVRALLSRPGAVLAATPVAQSWGRVFRDGIVVNVLNPKVALFFLALLPQFVDPARGAVPEQIVVLGALAMLIGLASDIVYALTGGMLGNLLARRPRYLRAQHYLSGGVYLGLGAAAALSGDPQR